VVTLSSYLDIKARSRLLMKGSFAFSANSRKTWARCLLNSLSNIANLKNNQKAECYPETTARQTKAASVMWISRRYRSPGHHVDGGSSAEILDSRSATRWPRLYGRP